MDGPSVKREHLIHPERPLLLHGTPQDCRSVTCGPGVRSGVSLSRGCRCRSLRVKSAPHGTRNTRLGSRALAGYTVYRTYVALFILPLSKVSIFTEFGELTALTVQVHGVAVR